ncbi:FAD-dependent oxidoreductase [Salinispora arenicola]|uniref:FAD-dependent oxidoreductase n=1 Tax=Salinispora arenicola TaxID=168697 RepID=UPI0003782453|nr:FAD-dependent oxidoreductase [Salinispora arenicola]
MECACPGGQALRDLGGGEHGQLQGRISFTTSDIASGWSGYVDGAMESGLRAAEQVARYATR